MICTVDGVQLDEVVGEGMVPEEVVLNSKEEYITPCPVAFEICLGMKYGPFAQCLNRAH